MKANVCMISYCEECMYFSQQGDRCTCERTGEVIRWFQYACEHLMPKAEMEAVSSPLDEAEAPKMKVCPKCGQAKPVEAFSLNAASPDGRQTWCKECISVKMHDIYVKRKQQD